MIKVSRDAKIESLKDIPIIEPHLETVIKKINVLKEYENILNIFLREIEYFYKNTIKPVENDFEKADYLYLSTNMKRLVEYRKRFIDFIYFFNRNRVGFENKDETEISNEIISLRSAVATARGVVSQDDENKLSEYKQELDTHNSTRDAVVKLLGDIQEAFKDIHDTLSYQFSFLIDKDAAACEEERANVEGVYKDNYYPSFMD